MLRLCRAVIAANGGDFDELSKIVNIGQYCPKPHFSRAFPNFWRAVYFLFVSGFYRLLYLLIKIKQ